MRQFVTILKRFQKSTFEKRNEKKGREIKIRIIKLKTLITPLLEELERF